MTIRHRMSTFGRLFLIVLGTCGPVRADGLAILSIDPTVLGPNNLLQIGVGPTFSSPHARLGLYEAGRPARLADTVLAFDGTGHATVSLDADPGTYELRLLSDDAVPTVLSTAATVTVPGLNRSPGWLMLNGSFLASFPSALREPVPSGFYVPSAPSEPEDAGMPLFISGLLRRFDRRTYSKTHVERVASSVPLHWRTMWIPDWRDLTNVDCDWTAVANKIRNALQAAQNDGQRGFLGFAMPIDGMGDGPQPADFAVTVARLRKLLNAIVPEAAIIASAGVTGDGERTARDITVAGAQFDAILIIDRRTDQAESAELAWPIKAARRVAEERADYDLPIFVAPADAPPGRPAGLDELDDLMEGATGLVGSVADSNGWYPVVRRNLSLFIDSVTLEDIGVLPPQPGDAASGAVNLYDSLRQAGRAPQAARLTNVKHGPAVDAICVTLGDSIGDDVTRQLHDAARAGSRIYLEGAPQRDDKGQPAWKLGSLVGCSVTPFTAKTDNLHLDDAWTFGYLANSSLAVGRNITVTLNPPEPVVPARTAKPERGRDVLHGPRVLGHFNDGTPAIVENPVGKGKVIWMPCPLQTMRNSESKFYAAIAGALNGSLIAIDKRPSPDSDSSVPPSIPSHPDVGISIRRSSKGIVLLELVNREPNAVSMDVAVPAAPGIAYDLMADKELPSTARGLSIHAAVTLPVGGFALLAFGNRKIFDAERDEPVLRARFR